jgi:hypothetical protein
MRQHHKQQKPNPKIYLRVVGRGKFEIVDGHQRLLAIFNFVKRDGYPLRGTVVHQGMAFFDLNEKRYDHA